MTDSPYIKWGPWTSEIDENGKEIFVKKAEYEIISFPMVFLGKKYKESLQPQAPLFVRDELDKIYGDLEWGKAITMDKLNTYINNLIHVRNEWKKQLEEEE